MKTNSNENAGLIIEASITVKAQPAYIWQALTDSDDLENWWGEGVKLEPIKNGNFKEFWQDDEGNEHVASGKVRSLVVNKEIVFTWKEKFWPKESITECKISIEDNGKFRTIHIQHKGWETLPAADQKKTMKDFRTGWSYHLKELQAYLD